MNCIIFKYYNHNTSPIVHFNNYNDVKNIRNKFAVKNKPSITGT